VRHARHARCNEDGVVAAVAARRVVVHGRTSMSRERQKQFQKEWFEHKLAAVKSKHDVAAHVRKGGDEFVLLDSRDREAYEKDHLPRALPMPLSEVDGLARELDAKRAYVVYCWHAT
jgi:hypothetical protein